MKKKKTTTATAATAIATTTTTSMLLLGKVVMTLGLELRRAYINDLTVLHDGTLVSALDDGHIQLWKHGAQQHDVIHPYASSSSLVDQRAGGGVEAVVACDDDYWEDGKHDDPAPAPTPPLVAFASAGRGSIHLWTDSGQVVLALSASPVPNATTPRGLLRLPLRLRGRGNNNNMLPALAAHFRSTHSSDPHQFRLPPQNETERQRRAQALAQEQALQDAIHRTTRSVQIWYSCSSDDVVAAAANSSNAAASNSGSNSSSSSPQLPSLKSLILNKGNFAISCLESIPIRRASSSSSSSSSTCLLVSGDVSGALRVWRVEVVEQNNSDQLVAREQAYVRLSCSRSSSSRNDGSPSATSNVSACSIVCLKSLRNGMLAVSTTAGHNGGMPLAIDDADILPLARARAVHIISGLENDGDSSSFSILVTINGHQDAVSCLCELPNGDLLTTGGKMDATIKLWSHKQIYERNSESRTSGSSTSNIGETHEEHDVLVDPTKTLPSSEAGYVFALQVLLDKKPRSSHFAVAAARYNVVKILL
jgi:WD40 repeat protein